MVSNFAFLKDRFPVLAHLGSLAENYIYPDANSCLIKLGQLGEELVKSAMTLDGIVLSPTLDNTQVNRIRCLKKEDLLPKNIDDILYSLRTKRNDAIHDSYESLGDCKTFLKMAHTLGSWFMQVYGDWQYEPEPFVLPEEKGQLPDYESIIKEKEAEIDRLTKLAEQRDAEPVSRAERKKQSSTVAGKLNLSE